MQLSDVVSDGAIRGDYYDAEEQFLQSEPHIFYIKGTTPVRTAPVVHSMLPLEDSAFAL